MRSDFPPSIGTVVELTADPERVRAYKSELVDPAALSVEERELEEVRR